MQSFSTEEIGRCFILRLDQGDYLLESINEFIKKNGIKTGVVVSAIGTLDQCVMHIVTTTGYPAVEHFERWEDKPLELSSIDGVIADSVPHLHMVVADSKKAYSGHLENGCRILYLGEVVILELKSLPIRRVRNSKNILELAEISE